MQSRVFVCLCFSNSFFKNSLNYEFFVVVAAAYNTLAPPKRIKVAIMVTTTKGTGGTYPLMTPLKAQPSGIATIHPFAAIFPASNKIVLSSPPLLLVQLVLS
jgi:hypothetical protein